MHGVRDEEQAARFNFFCIFMYYKGLYTDPPRTNIHGENQLVDHFSMRYLACFKNDIVMYAVPCRTCMMPLSIDLSHGQIFFWVGGGWGGGGVGLSLSRRMHSTAVQL